MWQRKRFIWKLLQSSEWKCKRIIRILNISHVHKPFECLPQILNGCTVNNSNNNSEPHSLMHCNDKITLYCASVVYFHVYALSFVIQSIYTFSCNWNIAYTQFLSRSHPLCLFLYTVHFAHTVLHLVVSQYCLLLSIRFFLCLFTFSRCNHIKYARISGCNM